MKTLAKVRWIALAFLFGTSVLAWTQDAMGVSIGYEYIPYVSFADPEPGLEDVEIQLAALDLGAAFPLSFGEGATLLLNRVDYQRLGFSYDGWQAGMGERVTQAHSISFSTFLLQTLTERWKLAVLVAPGIASDLEGKLTTYDFTLSAILGAMRTFGEQGKLTLGSGLAYTWDFGDPYPLPFLYLDWKIGARLNIGGIIPSDLTVIYAVAPFLELGARAGIGGNRYHGDPDKFGVDNPQMKYSVGTVGSVARIHFTEWLHLNLEGGYTVYRNFAFWDGGAEAADYDMENTYYLKAATVIGM